MNTLLLLLLDSRAPAGAHHHSGGMEAAVTAGLVTGLPDVEQFCRARLRTSGRTAAAFAAAACRLQRGRPKRPPAAAPAEGPGLAEDWARLTQGPGLADEPGLAQEPGMAQEPGLAKGPGLAEDWARLDAELDARTPSEATRAASRQLGAGLRRLLRSMLPGADLVTPWARCGPPAPHHPLVLGAGVALAGGPPELAARAAALAACAGPASAAVRLLGLDPLATAAMLTRLAPDIDQAAELAARSAAGPPGSLPCEGAPALDLLADVHLTAEVRLFAS